jgi:hypothetical protein
MVGLLELRAEPRPKLLAELAVQRQLGDSRPCRRTSVGDLYGRFLEQTRVEVDDPLGLRKSAWIRLVRGHLGLWDMEAESLENAGEEARPAPTGTGDEDKRPPGRELLAFERGIRALLFSERRSSDHQKPSGWESLQLT